MGKVVITLTTVPERLTFEPEDGFKLCLKSLCEQNHSEYEIHLNLPHTYNVTKQEYVIPQWLEDYQTKYPHLKIFRMEDMGPPTKVVPTMLLCYMTVEVWFHLNGVTLEIRGY